jgi:hypothetical protein
MTGICMTRKQFARASAVAALLGVVPAGPSQAQTFQFTAIGDTGHSENRTQ